MLDAEEAYQQYRDMVYGYLIRLCRDRDLAEELTQETFYQAMKNWKRYEGKSSVGTWLCAIARNQFLRIMRRQSPLPLDNVPEASVPDFTEMVAEHSLALSAHQALHRLPEPYREVLTLKTFCELSSKEIAALFGKSESWARVTAYRAKQMLLDAMKACKEKVKPQIGLAARKFGRRGRKRSAAQISHHKVPA